MNTQPEKTYSGSASIDLGLADASGVSLGSITSITPNNSTNKKYLGTITIKDQVQSSKVYLELYQAPQPLNFSFTIGTSVLVLNWNSAVTFTDKASEIANGGTIEVYKNGVKLSTGTNGYTLSTTDKNINLDGTAKAAPGDVYTVYIQSGNAPAESVTKSYLVP